MCPVMSLTKSCMRSRTSVTTAEPSWLDSSRFFKNTPWPETEALVAQVGNSAVFPILYKELYFRQVYANVNEGPSLEQGV